MKGPDLLINNRVNYELIYQLYSRFNTILNSELLGTVIFIGVLWDGIPHNYLIIWLGYNLTVNIFARLIAFLYHRYQRQHKIVDINFWNNLFTFAVFLQGTVWGYAGLLFLVITNDIYNVIIIIVLMTVSGTANAELFQNKTSYLAFVAPIYLVMLYLSISHYGDIYTALFIGVLIYITFTTVLAGKSSDVLRNALFLRYKHKELLEYLSYAGTELDAANKKLSNKIHIRRKAEKLLLDLATHDYLTKLPNRNFFNKVLQRSFALSARNKTLVALFFIDLDHFKQVNDSYGHDVGDKVLIELAKRLQHAVRKIDMIVRFGGDEFCIVFDDLKGVDEIKLIAQKILGEIVRPYEIENYTITISASIGIGIYPNDSSDIDSLFKIADIALYWAKKAGRNTFKIFDE